MDQFYISSGEKTMMYTLRHRFTDYIYTADGKVEIVRDYYYQNLSIDKERALEKARAILGSDKIANENDLPDLAEIRRLEKVEIAARRREIDELEERERQDRIDAALCRIDSGRWPWGKFRRETFDTAGKSYILYFMNIEEDKTDIVLTVLQAALRKRFSSLFNLPKANGEYYGTEKSRQEFTATLIESFGFDSFYGWTYIEKYIKDSGELLVYMGAGWGDGERDIGDKLTFKATIKGHELYNDEKQTKIQRLKLIA